MSIRIDITAWPRKLADLEDLCRVAREQGCTDEASVGIGSSNSTVTVQTNSQDTIPPIERPGAALDVKNGA